VEFLYELSGQGWASGYIAINDHEKVHFTCSYTSEGISELLFRLYQLAANVPFYEMDPNPMFWDEEPDGTCWTLKRIGKNDLLIEIKHSQENPEETKTLVNEQINFWEFVSIVMKQADILLQRQGFIGYVEAWGSEFPLSSYLRLKSLMEDDEILLKESENHHVQTNDMSDLQRELTWLHALTKNE